MRFVLVLASCCVLFLATGIRAQEPYHPVFVKDTPLPVAHAIEAANDHLRHGRFRDASLAYRVILEYHPDHRSAQLGAASAATMQGDFSQAATLLRQILEVDPTDPFAQAGLALIVPIHHLERHERWLNQAIASTPEVAALHFAAGNFYASQTRWLEAEQSYGRALAIACLQPPPIAAAYFYNHAVAREHIGDVPGAAQRYQQAYEHANPYEDALRAVAKERFDFLQAAHP